MLATTIRESVIKHWKYKKIAEMIGLNVVQKTWFYGIKKIFGVAFFSGKAVKQAPSNGITYDVENLNFYLLI